ncbi:hypothetical protein H6F77_11815 [Microcoleus sp. FACHB-831]|uniref:hypothetical protein n=1 Tax=Microcoleus sp. FACHB-831 TaxID=2692827 RepID=UPI0016854C97|nr:hypothetical protein [Microcoleus sp. FACHB-831]MBD1921776.1 hypothetical protein [Microcoleus sp. FACHB-831]
MRSLSSYFDNCCTNALCSGAANLLHLQRSRQTTENYAQVFYYFDIGSRSPNGIVLLGNNPAVSTHQFLSQVF